MVSTHYLVKNHPAFFGTLVARAVDIREDNLNGAMRFACDVLAFLNAAGHDDGAAVAAVRRAGAQVLVAHGQDEESSRWTAAAEAAERNL